MVLARKGLYQERGRGGLWEILGAKKLGLNTNAKVDLVTSTGGPKVKID